MRILKSLLVGKISIKLSLGKKEDVIYGDAGLAYHSSMFERVS